ncbi:FixH family protein [Alkalihalobacillus sp. NPDC078783]
MIERLQPRVNVSLLGLIIFFGFLFYQTIVNPMVEAGNEESWDMHVVHVAEGYRPFKYEAVQLFLQNSQGESAVSEQVKIDFSSQSGLKETHWMHHVEDGLYQAELSFKESGDWKGIVTVSNGKHQEEFPYAISVQPGAEKIPAGDYRK